MLRRECVYSKTPVPNKLYEEMAVADIEIQPQEFNTHLCLTAKRNLHEPRYHLLGLIFEKICENNLAAFSFKFALFKFAED